MFEKRQLEKQVFRKQHLAKNKEQNKILEIERRQLEDKEDSKQILKQQEKVLKKQKII